MPFRQNQGFLQGILNALPASLEAPDYTTMSKRGNGLTVDLECKYSGDPINIAIDSSGVRVHSGQEWSQVKHRKKDKKKWPTQSDSNQVQVFLEQIQAPINTVFADGAYDRNSTFDAIKKYPQNNDITVVIPPIKTASLPDESRSDLTQREQHILYLSKNIRDKWSSKFRYGQREKSEGVFSRLKTAFGERLSSRNFSLQKLEIHLKIKLLNQMNELYTEGFAR